MRRIIGTEVEVGEDAGGHAELDQVAPHAAQELSLARNSDWIAEVDLDACIGVHPLPLNGGDYQQA